MSSYMYDSDNNSMDLSGLGAAKKKKSAGPVSKVSVKAVPAKRTMPTAKAAIRRPAVARPSAIRPVAQRPAPTVRPAAKRVLPTVGAGPAVGYAYMSPWSVVPCPKEESAFAGLAGLDGRQRRPYGARIMGPRKGIMSGLDFFGAPKKQAKPQPGMISQAERKQLAAEKKAERKEAAEQKKEQRQEAARQKQEERKLVVGQRKEAAELKKKQRQEQVAERKAEQQQKVAARKEAAVDKRAEAQKKAAERKAVQQQKAADRKAKRLKSGKTVNIDPKDEKKVEAIDQHASVLAADVKKLQVQIPAKKAKIAELKQKLAAKKAAKPAMAKKPLPGRPGMPGTGKGVVRPPRIPTAPRKPVAKKALRGMGFGSLDLLELGDEGVFGDEGYFTGGQPLNTGYGLTTTGTTALTTPGAAAPGMVWQQTPQMIPTSTVPKGYEKRKAKGRLKVDDMVYELSVYTQQQMGMMVQSIQNMEAMFDQLVQQSDMLDAEIQDLMAQLSAEPYPTDVGYQQYDEYGNPINYGGGGGLIDTGYPVDYSGGDVMEPGYGEIAPQIVGGSDSGMIDEGYGALEPSPAGISPASEEGMFSESQMLPSDSGAYGAEEGLDIGSEDYIPAPATPIREKVTPMPLPVPVSREENVVPMPVTAADEEGAGSESLLEDEGMTFEDSEAEDTGSRPMPVPVTVDEDGSGAGEDFYGEEGDLSE